eukprot:TRINITY_DN1145_c0_g1_i6.p1 TRINITY_DN1145_c0_g1~~TRINITY_DN1145_c0_g1_i6.p1  ORF type:complete len:450 (+),score=159.77 TRINITY_DN1145_c0_g1_i6:361-1710(+)
MLFKGKEDVVIDNTDEEYAVRQESFFYYLFGVKEVGCYACIDIDKEEITLFIPTPVLAHKIFMVVYDKGDFEKMYGTRTEYVKDMEMVVEKMGTKKIYVNYGKNSDSGLTTLVPEEKWMEKYPVDKDAVHPILCECRVIKSPQEIEIMRVAAKAGVECHLEAMKHCRPGVLESYVLSKLESYGKENYNTDIQPYLGIVASGMGAATLHYRLNDKLIEENELILCDCGQLIQGYASDITTTFPSNGKFTPEQKAIYNIVLKMNRTVEAKLKPGVSWRDMHLLSERILLSGLKDLGILKGDVKEMAEKRVGYLFMPHGLGHLIGIDVHEVGGYLKSTPERDAQPGLRNLRTARHMLERMAITVEPGCYFIDFLLNDGAKLLGIPTSYIDFDKIQPYMKLGGVRIEDDVVITETGIDLLSAGLPRTVEQIEAFMAGKDWKAIPEGSWISEVA